MEGYAVDGLAAGGEPAGGEVLAPELARVAAAAEAAEPGSGLAAVRVILLVRAAGRLGTLEDMEVLAVEESRRIGRESLQLALDNQALGEVRLAGVTGSDGVRRTRLEDSGTSLLTVLGDVRVRRVAYRSGGGGVPALHPRDAVLNLPPGGFSWQVRKLAEMTCRPGTYDSAREIIRVATGAVIGKRQLQEMMQDCAADAEAFARDRPVPAVPVLTGPDGQDRPAAGVASADGKGISMLPGALRAPAARKAARKGGTRARKLGSGEKSGNKRIAETGVVYDCLPPGGEPRTAAEVMRRPPGQPARHPRALNRWYTCDIVSSCADVIAGVFAEIDRRDPRHERQWIGLVDGDNHQIGAFLAEAGKRGMDMPLLIDFIHVIGYLWKAAWCFVPAGAIPAAEAQVTGWGEAILLGHSADVAADIGRRAAEDPPRPGSEHAKNISKTLAYLENKEPYLDYPTALASGWPISTGIIEGACRHLIGDRMGVTGARWGLPGAQSVLWLRAIHASGDTGPYWDHHIAREHQRNHLSRYQDPPAALTLAA
ncbi:MAG TPA: ISKra4 family transposase [Streptosporangiaceae bacterium]|nr:ISKra4 family transposase [Streptosporangiaceae bacterium]